MLAVRKVKGFRVADYYNNVNEEVAAAEAALKAAQERLAAARAKQAQEWASGQAQPFGQAPSRPQGQPQSQPYEHYEQAGYAGQPPYGAAYSQPGQAYQPYTQPGQAQSAPQAKDHVAAGLLAIFLGCLGIHKFYLGYNTPGFIMLAITVIGSIFSLGIAGVVMFVISVVEGIIYLTKTQTDFERIYVFGQKEWF